MALTNNYLLVPLLKPCGKVFFLHNIFIDCTLFVKLQNSLYSTVYKLLCMRTFRVKAAVKSQPFAVNVVCRNHMGLHISIWYIYAEDDCRDLEEANWHFVCLYMYYENMTKMTSSYSNYFLKFFAY